jgi:excinuclease ABC subunit B
VLKKSYNAIIPAERKKLISALEREMLERDRNLEFEQAAAIKDEIQRIKEIGSN